MKCPYCSFENTAGEDRCVQCLHSLMQQNLPKPKKLDALQSVMMTAPISDLITGKDLLVASPNDSIKKVVDIFQKEDKNCVLVYDRKKMVGIMSHRDILRKVVGTQKDLSKVKVSQVMTPNPEFVTPDAPIAYVVNKMAMGGYRHVPVLSHDGSPLSIIIIKDVLGYLSKRKKA